MTVSMILIGMVCGNLGAVLLRPFNLGLWWNSVAGALGGAAVVYGPAYLGVDPVGPWYIALLAAGGAGLVLMLLCGALMALAYRH